MLKINYKQTNKTKSVRLWIFSTCTFNDIAFSALTLLVGWHEGHPACKKTEWWGAGVVVCLQQGADLHMAQLMPLPLTVSCFSKIQIGFTFLVPAHLCSPRKRAVKRVCVCVCVLSMTVHDIQSLLMLCIFMSHIPSMSESAMRTSMKISPYFKLDATLCMCIM